jgi:hypothetical protein
VHKHVKKVPQEEAGMGVSIHRRRAAIASGALVFLLGCTPFARSFTLSLGVPFRALASVLEKSGL